MRNSFNTAGYSEVVHETRADPREARFLYSGRARYSPRRGLSAWNGPAILGTVKSARRFSFELNDDAWRDCDVLPATDAPAPIDLALTGIGACSVKTLVGGGSAQGVVFDTVELLIEQGAAEGGAIDCRFEVGGPDQDELLQQLLDKVQKASPNHVTLTTRLPFEVTCVDESGETARETFAGVDAVTRLRFPAARRIRWISGVQVESHPVDGPGPVLRVDSPKQLTGVDWGPNAQEYLLMGLASDVAAHLGQLSRERLGRQPEWNVVADARLDIRGHLSAAAAALVTVHLQDIRCAISASGVAEAGLWDIAREAMARSEVRSLMSDRHIVGVALKPPPTHRDPGWQRGRSAS
jgi:uncharacterized OsmC-like protein